MASTHQDWAGISVEELHLALLQALPDALCFMDPRGAIRFWNDPAEAISGFSMAEAVCARNSTDVLHLSDDTGQPAAKPATDQETGRFFLRHKDGHAVPVTVRRHAVYNRNSISLGTLLLFSLSEGSFRLDKLDNEPPDARPAWLREHAAAQPLQWLNTVNRPSALLLIKVDEFENLEHRLGPEAAGKVIDLVERTAANCTKTYDSSWRLPGGVVLASIRSATSLKQDAERLRALIQSASFQWWGQAVTITVSIGGSPVHANDAVADAVRRVEDHALIAARAGGNQAVLSDSQ